MSIWWWESIILNIIENVLLEINNLNTWWHWACLYGSKPGSIWKGVENLTIGYCLCGTIKKQFVMHYIPCTSKSMCQKAFKVAP